MPRIGTILLVSAILTGVLAGAAWFTASHRQEILTDDSGIELPTSRANPRDILWQPPTNIDPAEVPPETLAGTISPDGDRFVFSAPGPAGDRDLFESRRTHAGWTTRRLTEINSSDHDTTPTYGPDGRWLWFASDRAGGEGGYDLWRAPAAGASWGKPEHFVSELVQSQADELSPALLPSGKALAFARRASGDEPSDLVLVALEGGLPSNTIAHTLNTDADERTPTFSPSGDFLYFASDRPGGAGGQDLYRARLSGTDPGEPTWLGEEVNSAGDETDPTLDTAGFRLRFRSQTEDIGGYRETTAREVYRTVRTRWPSFGMGSQLLALLPWLLAALALVLLFAALRNMAAGEQWRRRWGTLGLMARCVLASMAIHAMLAFLLSLWQVQTGAPLPGERGEMQVALTTRSSMSDIAAQLQASTLGSRAMPDASTRPPTELPNETRTESFTPAQATAPSSVASPSDALARQTFDAPQTPAQTTERVEASPLPAASRSNIDESQSRQRQVGAQPTEVRLQTPGVRADAVRPRDAAPQDAVVGEIGDATVPVETAQATETQPDLLPRQDSAPTLPAAPRQDVNEARSDQQLTQASPRSTPALDSALPDPVALDASQAQAPAPTPARLAEASTPDETTSPEGVPPPNLALPSFNAPALPTLAVATEEAEASPDAPSFRDAPAPSFATSDAREDRITPDAARTSPIERTISEATESTALPSAPPLPTFAMNLDTSLPTPGASPDPDTETPTRSTDRADTLPTPIAISPVLDLRAEAREGDSPPLIDPLADAIGEIVVAAPSLPLSAPQDQAPMLPMARVIAGIVTDNQTGDPVPDATVRLDGEADTIRTTRAGDDGRFTLTPAQLPEFAALTASAEGYIPTAINVAESQVGDGIWVELRLDPASMFDIALDDEPRVHHLGNDEFTGAINSQFQVKSSGTRYSATLTLERAQLDAGLTGAEFRAMVRGAQNANPITVNGRRLSRRMTDSPADGSFGDFVARIPLRLLREGENVIEIRATDREGTDIDDFEFVNPRIVLTTEQERTRDRRGSPI